jgi:phosphosulfolactate synthase (CoM biosynthesis protein A)
VDKIGLVITLLVGKGRQDAVVSVIEACRVTSDYVHFVKFGGCLVSICVGIEIQY